MDNNNSNTVVDALDLEEEENVDVEVETSDNQPGCHTNTNTLAMPSELQQIEDDNNDIPLRMGSMIEAISNATEGRVVEVEQIDDNDGPEPPAAMLEESLNASDPEIARKVSVALQNNLASVNGENSPPVPFNSAEYEDDKDIAKKKKKVKDEMMNRKPTAVSTSSDTKEVVLPPSDRDLIYEPSREVVEGSEGISDNTNTGRGDANRSGWEDIGSGSNVRDIESQTRTNDQDIVGSINNDPVVDTEATAEAPTSTIQEVGDTAIHIPDAFLVEDVEEEVYDATFLEPTLPWWKQRRTKILLGFVLVILGTFAIALGFTLSQSNKTLFVTPPPTVSFAPSLSIAPSTPPPPITYECFGEDDGGEFNVLYRAVRSYVDQDCVNNTKCIIAQTYGWPINSWCVGNVADMSYLFDDMDTFNEDINGWNTSSVTSVRGMFQGATSFNGDVSNFDTSSVTDMFAMFWEATLFNGDVSNFDSSSVTDMSFMFGFASSFNGDLSNFDTSRVTDMNKMFFQASLFSGDVSNFDTSSVTSMIAMFSEATSFSEEVYQTLTPRELLICPACSVKRVYSMAMYQTLIPQALLLCGVCSLVPGYLIKIYQTLIPQVLLV